MRDGDPFFPKDSRWFSAALEDSNLAAAGRTEAVSTQTEESPEAAPEQPKTEEHRVIGLALRRFESCLPGGVRYETERLLGAPGSWLAREFRINVAHGSYLNGAFTITDRHYVDCVPYDISDPSNEGTALSTALVRISSPVSSKPTSLGRQFFFVAVSPCQAGADAQRPWTHEELATAVPLGGMRVEASSGSPTEFDPYAICVDYNRFTSRPAYSQGRWVLKPLTPETTREFLDLEIRQRFLGEPTPA